ncbi:MAG: (d)CMP kinase [Candidatus Pacebacteria bacterium]|nr:(d)CMP kinase [Candidatus Paceibacterota bacterium]
MIKIEKLNTLKQNLSITVVTIDGGAGTGKGTQRSLISRFLGFHGLDSGVLYRAVGYKVHSENIPIEDIETIESIALNLNIETKGENVIIDGFDRTKIVRSDEVGGKYSSMVAKIPEVRAALNKLQLSKRKYPGLVSDGRDQGFVFDTPYRFFLKTRPEIRAQRRVKQFERMGLPANYNDILEEILRRDHSDVNNPANPLKPHPRAFIIDNSNLKIKETAKIILCACQLKKAFHY